MATIEDLMQQKPTKPAHLAEQIAEAFGMQSCSYNGAAAMGMVAHWLDARGEVAAAKLLLQEARKTRGLVAGTTTEESTDGDD